MTRRVLQAIAGAAHGGAEIFFTRLAAALQRAGEPQRVLIRRNPSRAKCLRAAGVGVAQRERRLFALPQGELGDRRVTVDRDRHI